MGVWCSASPATDWASQQRHRLKDMVQNEAMPVMQRLKDMVHSETMPVMQRLKAMVHSEAMLVMREPARTHPLSADSHFTESETGESILHSVLYTAPRPLPHTSLSAVYILSLIHI